MEWHGAVFCHELDNNSKHATDELGRNRIHMNLIFSHYLNDR